MSSLYGGKLTYYSSEDKPGICFTPDFNCPSIRIGSSFKCDVRVNKENVLKLHARIFINKNGDVKIKNYSKENPVLVNSKEVHINSVLKNNDIINILNCKFMWNYNPKNKKTWNNALRRSLKRKIKMNEGGNDLYGDDQQKPGTSINNNKTVRRVISNINQAPKNKQKRITVHEIQHRRNMDFEESFDDIPEEQVTPTKLNKDQTVVEEITPKFNDNLTPLEASTPFLLNNDIENLSPNITKLSKLERSDSLILSYTPNSAAKTNRKVLRTSNKDILFTPSKSTVSEVIESEKSLNQTKIKKTIRSSIFFIDLTSPDQSSGRNVRVTPQVKQATLLKSALKNASLVKTPKSQCNDVQKSGVKKILNLSTPSKGNTIGGFVIKPPTKLETPNKNISRSRISLLSEAVKTPKLNISRSARTPMRNTSTVEKTKITECVQKEEIVDRVVDMPLITITTISDDELNECLESIENEELPNTPEKEVVEEVDLMKTPSHDIHEHNISGLSGIKEMLKTPGVSNSRLAEDQDDDQESNSSNENLNSEFTVSHDNITNILNSPTVNVSNINVSACTLPSFEIVPNETVPFIDGEMNTIQTTDETFDELIGKKPIKNTYPRKTETPVKKLTDDETKTIEKWVESVVNVGLEEMPSIPNNNQQILSNRYSNVTPQSSEIIDVDSDSSDDDVWNTIVDEADKSVSMKICCFQDDDDDAVESEDENKISTAPTVSNDSTSFINMDNSSIHDILLNVDSESESANQTPQTVHPEIQTPLKSITKLSRVSLSEKINKLIPETFQTRLEKMDKSDRVDDALELNESNDCYIPETQQPNDDTDLESEITEKEIEDLRIDDDAQFNILQLDSSDIIEINVNEETMVSNVVDENNEEKTKELEIGDTDIDAGISLSTGESNVYDANMSNQTSESFPFGNVCTKPTDENKGFLPNEMIYNEEDLEIQHESVDLVKESDINNENISVIVKGDMETVISNSISEEFLQNQSIDAAGEFFSNLLKVDESEQIIENILLNEPSTSKVFEENISSNLVREIDVIPDGSEDKVTKQLLRLSVNQEKLNSSQHNQSLYSTPKPASKNANLSHNTIVEEETPPFSSNTSISTTEIAEVPTEKSQSEEIIENYEKNLELLACEGDENIMFETSEEVKQIIVTPLEIVKQPATPARQSRRLSVNQKKLNSSVHNQSYSTPKPASKHANLSHNTIVEEETPPFSSNTSIITTEIAEAPTEKSQSEEITENYEKNLESLAFEGDENNMLETSEEVKQIIVTPLEIIKQSATPVRQSRRLSTSKQKTISDEAATLVSSKLNQSTRSATPVRKECPPFSSNTSILTTEIAEVPTEKSQSEEITENYEKNLESLAFEGDENIMFETYEEVKQIIITPLEIVKQSATPVRQSRRLSTSKQKAISEEAATLIPSKLNQSTQSATPVRKSRRLSQLMSDPIVSEEVTDTREEVIPPRKVRRNSVSQINDKIETTPIRQSRRLSTSCTPASKSSRFSIDLKTNTSFYGKDKDGQPIDNDSEENESMVLQRSFCNTLVRQSICSTVDENKTIDELSDIPPEEKLISSPIKVQSPEKIDVIALTTESDNFAKVNVQQRSKSVTPVKKLRKFSVNQNKTISEFVIQEDNEEEAEEHEGSKLVTAPSSIVTPSRNVNSLSLNKNKEVSTYEMSSSRISEFVTLEDNEDESSLSISVTPETVLKEEMEGIIIIDISEGPEEVSALTNNTIVKNEMVMDSSNLDLNQTNELSEIRSKSVQLAENRKSIDEEEIESVPVSPTAVIEAEIGDQSAINISQLATNSDISRVRSKSVTPLKISQTFSENRNKTISEIFFRENNEDNASDTVAEITESNSNDLTANDTIIKEEIDEQKSIIEIISQCPSENSPSANNTISLADNENQTEETNVVAELVKSEVAIETVVFDELVDRNSNDGVIYPEALSVTTNNTTNTIAIVEREAEENMEELLASCSLISKTRSKSVTPAKKSRALSKNNKTFSGFLFQEDEDDEIEIIPKLEKSNIDSLISPETIIKEENTNVTIIDISQQEIDIGTPVKHQEETNTSFSSIKEIQTNEKLGEFSGINDMSRVESKGITPTRNITSEFANSEESDFDKSNVHDSTIPPKSVNPNRNINRLSLRKGKNTSEMIVIAKVEIEDEIEDVKITEESGINESTTPYVIAAEVVINDEKETAEKIDMIDINEGLVSTNETIQQFETDDIDQTSNKSSNGVNIFFDDSDSIFPESDSVFAESEDHENKSTSSYNLKMDSTSEGVSTLEGVMFETVVENKMFSNTLSVTIAEELLPETQIEVCQNELELSQDKNTSSKLDLFDDQTSNSEQISTVMVEEKKVENNETEIEITQIVHDESDGMVNSINLFTEEDELNIPETQPDEHWKSKEISLNKSLDVSKKSDVNEISDQETQADEHEKSKEISINKSLDTSKKSDIHEISDRQTQRDEHEKCKEMSVTKSLDDSQKSDVNKISDRETQADEHEKSKEISINKSLDASKKSDIHEISDRQTQGDEHEKSKEMSVTKSVDDLKKSDVNEISDRQTQADEHEKSKEISINKSLDASKKSDIHEISDRQTQGDEHEKSKEMSVTKSLDDSKKSDVNEISERELLDAVEPKPKSSNSTGEIKTTLDNTTDAILKSENIVPEKAEVINEEIVVDKKEPKENISYNFASPVVVKETKHIKIIQQHSTPYVDTSSSHSTLLDLSAIPITIHEESQNDSVEIRKSGRRITPSKKLLDQPKTFVRGKKRKIIIDDLPLEENNTDIQDKEKQEIVEKNSRKRDRSQDVTDSIKIKVQCYEENESDQVISNELEDVFYDDHINEIDSQKNDEPEVLLKRVHFNSQDSIHEITRHLIKQTPIAHKTRKGSAKSNANVVQSKPDAIVSESKPGRGRRAVKSAEVIQNNDEITEVQTKRGGRRVVKQPVVKNVVEKESTEPQPTNSKTVNEDGTKRGGRPNPIETSEKITDEVEEKASGETNESPQTDQRTKRGGRRGVKQNKQSEKIEDKEISENEEIIEVKTKSPNPIETSEKITDEVEEKASGETNESPQTDQRTKREGRRGVKQNKQSEKIEDKEISENEEIIEVKTKRGGRRLVKEPVVVNVEESEIDESKQTEEKFDEVQQNSVEEQPKRTGRRGVKQIQSEKTNESSIKAESDKLIGKKGRRPVVGQPVVVIKPPDTIEFHQSEDVQTNSVQEQTKRGGRRRGVKQNQQSNKIENNNETSDHEEIDDSKSKQSGRRGTNQPVSQSLNGSEVNESENIFEKPAQQSSVEGQTKRENRRGIKQNKKIETDQQQFDEVEEKTEVKNKRGGRRVFKEPVVKIVKELQIDESQQSEETQEPLVEQPKRGGRRGIKTKVQSPIIETKIATPAKGEGPHAAILGNKEIQSNKPTRGGKRGAKQQEAIEVVTEILIDSVQENDTEEIHHSENKQKRGAARGAKKTETEEQPGEEAKTLTTTKKSQKRGRPAIEKKPEEAIEVVTETPADSVQENDAEEIQHSVSKQKRGATRGAKKTEEEEQPGEEPRELTITKKPQRRGRPVIEKKLEENQNIRRNLQTDSEITEEKPKRRRKQTAQTTKDENQHVTKKQRLSSEAEQVSISSDCEIVVPNSSSKVRIGFAYKENETVKYEKSIEIHHEQKNAKRVLPTKPSKQDTDASLDIETEPVTKSRRKVGAKSNEPPAIVEMKNNRRDKNIKVDENESATEVEKKPEISNRVTTRRGTVENEAKQSKPEESLDNVESPIKSRSRRVITKSRKLIESDDNETPVKQKGRSVAVKSKDKAVIETPQKSVEQTKELVKPTGRRKAVVNDSIESQNSSAIKASQTETVRPTRSRRK